MKTDIQIAQEAEMKHIKEVAVQAGISEDELEFYGKYKAKLSDELWNRIKDNEDGKLVAIYAKRPEELYNKETLALEQIENATFHRKTPTVAEYCEKWLLMQSVHVRATTLTDYTSKVRRHIIAELGDKRMN